MGRGESFFKEAIRREAIESPETSPATMNTLSSPSLSPMSTTVLLRTEKDLLRRLEKPISPPFFISLMVLNSIFNIDWASVSIEGENQAETGSEFMRNRVSGCTVSLHACWIMDFGPDFCGLST
jgi:hypothetical protein